MLHKVRGYTLLEIFSSPSRIGSGQGHLIFTTQAWKQTLPPSDWILYYTSASFW